MLNKYNLVSIDNLIFAQGRWSLFPVCIGLWSYLS